MSLEQTIHDGIAGLLVAEEAALRIDTRHVSVVQRLNESAPGTGELPMVWVARPTLEDDQPQGYAYRRRTFEVVIFAIDAIRVSGDSVDLESHERIEDLRARVLSVLQGDPHFGLEATGVFGSMAGYSFADEPMAVGRKSMGLAIIVQLSVRVAVGG